MRAIKTGGGAAGVQTVKGKPVIFKAEPRVFAFDIETTKAPLKFPDAEIDQVCALPPPCAPAPAAVV